MQRDRIVYMLIDILGKAQMFLYTKIIQEHVWHSQNGKVTRITELTDPHLVNIFKKLEREKNRKDPLYRPIADEALRRGLVQYRYREFD